jgi:ElaA protein
MDAAIEEIGPRVSVLGAQAHLQGWYERFGYVVDGPEYDEDGILHVPMRRTPTP